MNIRPLLNEDRKQVLALIEKLRVVDEKKGWFDEDARVRSIPIDLAIQKGFVVLENDDIRGFITYFSEYGHPKIGWLGVDPEFHRKGIGAALINELTSTLKDIGARVLRVETPSQQASIGSPYEQTYDFYLRMGFVLEKIEKGQSPDGSDDMHILKRDLK